jgi:hypothetical protein
MRYSIRDREPVRSQPINAVAGPAELPDPQLVELVRVLARRAARRWSEEATRERECPGSA